MGRGKDWINMVKRRCTFLTEWNPSSKAAQLILQKGKKEMSIF